MGKQLVIYNALRASFDALCTTLSLDGVYTDDPFAADADVAGSFEPYLRASLFRNAPAWEGLSTGRMDQGLFQIDVVWPRSKVPANALSVVDAVLDAYPKGSLIPASIRLKVQRAPWVATGLVEIDRTYYPITISWVA